ncbi:MAG: AMP-binding protein, partial [Candidatus Dormibacteria bacterium]
MAASAEGRVLWEPGSALVDSCRLTDYARWLGRGKGVETTAYQPLWEWSVSDLGRFWASLLEYFEVAQPPRSEGRLPRREMPFARWFPKTKLNYAQQALGLLLPEREVVVAYSEGGRRQSLTGSQLVGQVGSLAAQLADLGVRPGDRVAAYLPNVPEAVVACLATASLGAVWSSCSPDFGEAAVLDRLAQIEPVVLVVADGYRYGGRAFDRRQVTEYIAKALPSVRHVVTLGVLDTGAAPWLAGAMAWQDLVSDLRNPTFRPVAFDHPLWILYSSGTTGPPKPIVHGHGGMVLEHLKALALHADIGPSSRFFWFTTTGWMMW